MSSDSAARYRHLIKLFRDASLPIIIEDLQGIVVAMNPAAEEAYGWKNDELLGHPIKTIVPPELYSHADQILERCRNGEIVRDIEGIRQHRDGTRGPVLLTLSLLRDESGQASSIASMATDISALKSAELDLREYKDQLEERVAARTAELESALAHLDQARATADRANQAKSDFLANMSHEIRTPMNAVLGMTHLCLDTDLSPKQEGYLKKIKSSARSLLTLVDDILDFSKIEAGKLSLEEVSFELDKVLSHQRDLFALAAARKGLELLFELDPELPKVFRGDALRLGQILTNLLANAIKFTDTGLISLEVSGQSVGANSHRLNFAISDTGIGVEPEKITSLFDSFSQADTSTTRRFGGTGLGLAISKQLVELMRGSLGAQSELGQGSRFWFEIELEACSTKSPPTRAFHGKKILLLESFAPSRESLVQILEQLGCRIASFDSMEVAEIVLRDGPAVDLLILSDRPDIWEQASRSQLRRHDLKGEPQILHLTEFGSPSQSPYPSPDEVLARPVLASHLESCLERLFFETVPSRKAVFRHGLARQFSSLSGLKVLLAEDNQINREVLSEILANVGVDITEAVDGESVIRVAREKRFDIILMDIQMPGIDGLSSSKILRKDGLETPIIAVTANVSRADKELYLAAGMNDFVAKPLEPYQLYTTMERWVPSREILDKNLALRTLMGNERLYHTLMEDLLLKYSEFETDFPLDDSKAARVFAHSLAGSAANLGLRQLTARAKKLEEACLEGKDLSPFVHVVVEAIKSVQQAYQAEETQRETETPKVESQLGSIKLETLEASLKSGDANSLSLLLSHLEGLGQEERAAYQGLVKMIEGFEFEEALAWLQSP